MRAVSGFLLAAVMWAQPAFQNLAPTGDDSAVYFSSPLRMKGTGQYPSQPKIFVWDNQNGVKLYQQKAPTIRSLSEGGLESDTAYKLVAPSISSDSRTIAITGLSDCDVGVICAIDVSRYQAEIRVAGGPPLLVNGVPSVSPNGRFVSLGPSVLRVEDPFEPPALTVLDLSTGQQIHLINAAGFPRRHSVANDGSAIIDDLNPSLTTPVQLRHWPGDTVPLNVPADTIVQVNAAASRVFYQIPDSSSPNTLTDLMTLDVATGAATQLATAETGLEGFVPFDISDDGSLLAFVQFAQAWIVHGDGTGLMQISNVQDPVVEVALAGSGRHLFAITNNSRMLRIDLVMLSVEEIIPATPAPSGLLLQPEVLTPGAFCEAIATPQPIPAVHSVSLFGHDFAILSASPSAIELQVPYDIPEGTGWPNAVLTEQPEGPFESAMLWAFPAQVSHFALEWYFADNHVAALHQDFSGPITPANPAHPGEIIHAYGSGFGPVAPQPALGQRASANPLSRITTPFVCGLEGDDSKLTSATILFAGLAPGWIGLYQFDISLPARPAGADAYLVCGNPPNPYAGNYASGLLPMAGK